MLNDHWNLLRQLKYTDEGTRFNPLQIYIRCTSLAVADN